MSDLLIHKSGKHFIFNLFSILKILIFNLEKKTENINLLWDFETRFRIFRTLHISIIHTIFER